MIVYREIKMIFNLKPHMFFQVDIINKTYKNV